VAFANQVAVITGASSGIGWAVARELAGRGCHVGLIARRGDRLQALADEIRTAGGKAAHAVADVGDRSQTLAAFRTVRDQLGPADLLFANSGVGQPTPLEPMNVPQVENMFRVNTLGVVYAIEAVLPEMLERGRGHLAAVSSLAAYKGFPGESAYCASKAAVSVYMEGLRIQLRSRGIFVTTICPGFIHTPPQDSWLNTPKIRKSIEDLHLTRIGLPDDIAKFALYLASDDSEYVTGGIYNIDGGFMAFKTKVTDYTAEKEK